LAFDYWVSNGDRTLSVHGGNPNLLWSPGEFRLSVIDHNQAFDLEGPTDDFSNHVFFEAKAAWSQSFRLEMEGLFIRAIAEFDEIFRELPADWLDVGGEDVHRSIKGSLSRFQNNSDNFWSSV
jgi:hypothetical protein